MIKEISDIHFPCLIQLNLGNNLIECLESLPRVRMLSLKHLSLSMRNLTQMKTTSLTFHPFESQDGQS